MKTKFDWGAIIKPTKECIENTMVKEEDYAISLGKTKDGVLALIREGRRTIEYWSANYWELLNL